RYAARHGKTRTACSEGGRLSGARQGSGAARALPAMVLFVAGAGYAWFLVRYPYIEGDTIKATYMAHTFPLLGVITGIAMDWIRRHWGWAYAAMTALFVIAALHNFPVWVTRYTAWVTY
ncbi:MAG: hypothetical protein AAF125_26270, partial [Chloroflexota bacterium]